MAISSSCKLNLPNTTSISATVKLLTTTTTNTLSFISRTSGSHLSKATTTSITASLSTSTANRHVTILEKLHLLPHSWPSSSTSDVQTLKVYEFNEGDRRSPAFLKLSKAPEKSLGDIVTFTNKLYSADLSAKLGITAGMIMYIENDEASGDRYEAVYSFYFGKYAHLSVQGPYFSNVDSELAVTGGTGVFEGARGKVKLTNVAYPYKLFYTFELKGMNGRLPTELIGGDAVEPSTLRTSH